MVRTIYNTINHACKRLRWDDGAIQGYMVTTGKGGHDGSGRFLPSNAQPTITPNKLFLVGTAASCLLC